MKILISLLLTLTTLMAGTGIAVAAPASAAQETQATETTVNINTADAQTLALNLDGVGTVKAQAIVDYRKANGPFTTAGDLRKVKGIGERTVEINKASIRAQ
ncbi:ComEA family DNA-binding protein [Marinobacter sp. 1Y8]